MLETFDIVFDLNTCICLCAWWKLSNKIYPENQGNIVKDYMSLADIIVYVDFRFITIVQEEILFCIVVENFGVNFMNLIKW